MSGENTVDTKNAKPNYTVLIKSTIIYNCEVQTYAVVLEINCHPLVSVY